MANSFEKYIAPIVPKKDNLLQQAINQSQGVSTYNPNTGVLTTPSGQQMSVAPRNVPQGSYYSSSSGGGGSTAPAAPAEVTNLQPAVKPAIRYQDIVQAAPRPDARTAGQIKNLDTKTSVDPFLQKRVNEAPNPIQDLYISGLGVGAGLGIAAIPGGQIPGTAITGLTLPGFYKAAAEVGQENARTATTNRGELYGSVALSKSEKEAALEAGRLAAGQDVQSKGLFEGILYELPGGQLVNGEAYKAGIKAHLQGQGYNEEEATRTAENLTISQVNAGAIGEVVGLSIASAGSNLLGRYGVAATTKGITANGSKFFNPGLATRGALGLLPAGAYEGGLFEIIQSKARNRNIDPFRLAFATATGAASAGLLGGAVIGLSAGAPRAAKGLQGALYAIDPTEAPGDFLDAGIAKASGKAPFPQIPVFTFTPGNGTPIPTRSYKNTSQIDFFNANVLDSGAKPTPFNFGGLTTVENPITEVLGVPVNPITETNTNPIVPVNPEPNVFNYTFGGNTNTNTNTNTQTDTFTNTFNFTPANTFVPVVAATGAPFLPFGFGGGDSGGRGKASGKLTYFNELESALKYFGALNVGSKLPSKAYKGRRAF